MKHKTHQLRANEDPWKGDLTAVCDAIGSCLVRAIYVGAVGRLIGSAAAWPLALTCHFQSRYLSDAAAKTLRDAPCAN